MVAFTSVAAHQHLDKADHADGRVLLLLQPGQGDGFAAQHVDQDVGVEQQHQGAPHSCRSASRIMLPGARVLD